MEFSESIYSDETIAREKVFLEELKDFKEKYPDFYIGAWTREDILSALSDDEIENEEDFCCTVVQRLYNDFDATVGVNWNVIEWTVDKVFQEM